VKDLATGSIEITAQNHNYAIDASTLARAQVSHVNLNDGVVEGVRCHEERCFSVQYHPEAGPGPHDARYLFDRFEHLLAGRRAA
jgi:carbamoyl-phosphate synthase small subunit